jgi:hypothetical protein
MPDVLASTGTATEKAKRDAHGFRVTERRAEAKQSLIKPPMTIELGVGGTHLITEDPESCLAN